MKILNLYAGIGGNRKLWPEAEITAVEIVPEIAAIYQKFFPQDKVVIADAHQYLLEHYKEFDFIWSSPPCPSHSTIRFMASKHGDYPPIFPDMKLYEEIIFLKHFCEGRWVIENVVSYYEPLIKPYEVGRHYLWSNFFISDKYVEPRDHNSITGKTILYGFDLAEYDTEHRKDQIIRNCVKPKLGLHVFNCAFKEKQLSLGE